jgi:hypothetical protein
MAKEPPFKRVRVVNEAAIVGAEWWQEGLVAGPDLIARRKMLKTVLLAGAGVATVAGIGAVVCASDDEIEATEDALDVQRKLGWNVGTTAPLQFPGAVRVPFDRSALGSLAADLAPRQDALRPFYVPTLFQSPGAVPSTPSTKAPIVPLRDVIEPVSTEATRVAFSRGRALATLFQGAPAGRAVFIDLSGAESVAFAAGLAGELEPVFLLDNWPHPRGVVPSHLTLGSAIYYRPLFLRLAQTRAVPSPPAFVLDRDRLSHYTDSSDRFDNRYLAKVPTTQNLQSLGVKQVIYVAPDSRRMEELDDLNADFVAYAAAGIEVRAVAANDFEIDWAAHKAAPSIIPSPTYDFEYDPSYCYGGSTHVHWVFWRVYGWGIPPHAYRGMPRRLSLAPSYRPRLRPTLYRSGMAKIRPSRFGRITIYRSRSSGRTVGGRFGRSGSWGRAGGRSGG